MVHITEPIGSSGGYTGLYAFGRIAGIDGTNVELAEEMSYRKYGFRLNYSWLIEDYRVQVITIPNFMTLTQIKGNIIAQPYSTSSGGGIAAFRCKGDCTLNKNILSYTGTSANTRSDSFQMTHSKLIDKFLCSSGGGIFITCGGTFRVGTNTRIGQNIAGNPGYGGNGGSVTYNSKTVSGGLGGVGGGGGGCVNHTISILVKGGDVGSDGINAYHGSGGGGCGGNGGNATYSYGGGGGGEQRYSGGKAGTSKSDWTSDGVVATDGTINGGNATKYAGAGGGGPGGNGGTSGTGGGKAGACLILLCNKLSIESANISTNGSNGGSGTGNMGSGGGGGTGFCYIACKEQVSD